MTHFTPFPWIALAIFTGIFAGSGQVLAKSVGPVVPPYVLVGVIGFVWATCSAIFMATSPVALSIGLPPIMSFEQTLALGAAALLVVMAVGFIFWIENLARFDALNKAPFAAYVVMTVELVAGVTMFSEEILLKWYQDKPIVVNLYQVGAICLAVGSITLFTLDPSKSSAQ